MAYFNHAFCKSFLVSSVEDGATVATDELTGGQLGLVSESDWKTVAVDGSALTMAGDLLYLVQGSYRTNDILGGNSTHGGYAESIKSKGINPRYVTRIWKAAASTASVSSASVEVGPKCHPCGENLMLRLDVKGSPALRFLNRNAYTIGDSMGDASTSNVPGLCCAAGQTYLDPAVALAKMGRMMLEDPITKDFIAEGDVVSALTQNAVGTGYDTSGTFATTGGSGSGLTIKYTQATNNTVETGDIVIANPGVGYKTGDEVTLVAGNSDATITLTVEASHGIVVMDGTSAAANYTIDEVLTGTGGFTASTDPVAAARSAKLVFKGAYVSTEFDKASFDTRDFYGKEPVQLRLSMIDETGEPCNDCGTVAYVPGTMPQTTGNQVLRSLLLSERYMQNPVHQGNTDFARMREIEGSKEIIDEVTLTDLYDVYYVQHSVPRFNNPSSTFDNDQYVYEIFVKQSAAASVRTDLEKILDSLRTTANAAGANVKDEL